MPGCIAGPGGMPVEKLVFHARLVRIDRPLEPSVKSLALIFRSASQHAGLKLACLLGLALWMMAFYFSPQTWPVLAAIPAPALAIDEWVPFGAHWALFYQSVFIVHTLAMWLPAKAETVRAYTRDVAIAYAVASVIFWVYPTVSPRPTEVNVMLYRWCIELIDGPGNAFPSLHAAIATLSAGYLWGHFRAAGASVYWGLALLVWWVMLMYSTLAVRQHRVLDLLAGAALVGAIVLFTRRSSRPTRFGLPPD